MVHASDLERVDSEGDQERVLLKDDIRHMSPVSAPITLGHTHSKLIMQETSHCLQIYIRRKYKI